METNGHIIIHPTPDGCRLAWQGGPIVPVTLSDAYWQQQTEVCRDIQALPDTRLLRAGSFTLRVLAYDAARDCLICQRVE